MGVNNSGVAAGQQTAQAQVILSIQATSTVRRLGAFFLAILLYTALALPAQAARTAFTGRTAGTGVLDLSANPPTGLYCADNPVSRADPTGHFGDFISPVFLVLVNLKLFLPNIAILYPNYPMDFLFFPALFG